MKLLINFMIFSCIALISQSYAEDTCTEVVVSPPDLGFNISCSVLDTKPMSLPYTKEQIVKFARPEFNYLIPKDSWVFTYDAPVGSAMAIAKVHIDKQTVVVVEEKGKFFWESEGLVETDGDIMIKLRTIGYNQQEVNSTKTEIFERDEYDEYYTTTQAIPVSKRLSTRSVGGVEKITVVMTNTRGGWKYKPDAPTIYLYKLESSGIVSP